MFGNGDGTFGPLTAINIGQDIFSEEFDDFNHDGKLDIAAGSTNRILVLLGNGDGTFQAPISSPALVGPLRSGDLNADGYPDIAGIYNQCLGVLFGNGDGTFQPEVDWNLNYLYDVKIADFNQDGKLDLLAAQYYLQVRLLRNLGGGTFAPPDDYFFGELDGGIAVGNFNQDSFPDLAAALPANYSSVVDVMLNSGAQ
jgi:hypothetical protein